MSQRTVLIIRGCSGAGKSTLAKTLANLNPDSCICEADTYFLDKDGNYKFDATQLRNAHNYCQVRFQAALDAGVSLIIISNTNTTAKEYKFYLDKAHEHGYITHVLLVERHLNTQSVHGVPQLTLERQAANLRQSIQL